MTPAQNDYIIAVNSLLGKIKISVIPQVKALDFKARQFKGSSEKVGRHVIAGVILRI